VTVKENSNQQRKRGENAVDGGCKNQQVEIHAVGGDKDLREKVKIFENMKNNFKSYGTSKISASVPIHHKMRWPLIGRTSLI
jgi:hypothetical protein